MAAGPTIVAKFIADTSQMTGEVDKATAAAGGKMDSFAKGAATVLGSAFVTAKIVEYGKASVDAAAADAEAQAILATTLKNTTGATNDQIAAAETYITKLSEQTAIADDELRPAMGTLARAFGDTQKAQDALALATDVSAGTGKDLATVTDAMSKAAMGNTGALKKLGVETKNADGSTKSLDQIMQSMSQTFSGQAAVAADTTAGKMRGAQIQMGELQETIGAGLLPVISSLAGILAAFLPTLSKFAPIILPLVAAFALWSAAVSVATTIQTAFGVSLALSVGWIALIAVGIAALVVGVIWAYNNVEVFRDVVQAAFKVAGAAFDLLKSAAEAVFNWIRSNWPTLLAILTGPIGVATLLITKNWDTIKDAATAVYDWVKDKFDAIAGAISAVVGAISGAISAVVSAIKAPINALIGAWNSLEFRVPTVTLPTVHIPGLPDIGGGSFGGQVIGFPNLPKLAAGGVLTSPTLFVGGEAGTEIVAPESLLRAIIGEEAGGHYTLNIYPRTADASDIAYGFRRLELMAGVR